RRLVGCGERRLRVPQEAPLRQGRPLIHGPADAVAFIQRKEVTEGQTDDRGLRDRLSAAVGLADGRPLRLFSPYMTENPGLKAEEMIAHAKKLGLPFQKDATVESVIADFLRKHPAPKPK